MQAVAPTAMLLVVGAMLCGSGCAAPGAAARDASSDSQNVSPNSSGPASATSSVANAATGSSSAAAPASAVGSATASVVGSFPSSWVDLSATRALLLQWTVTDGVVTGTADSVDVATPSSTSLGSTAVNVAGHLTGDTITLRVGPADLSGTVSMSSLVLKTPDDGSTSTVLTFVPGTAATYRAAAAALQLRVKQAYLDGRLQSDLRVAATDMETYATDNTTYPSSIASTAPGVVDVGGSPVQLTGGDSITLQLSKDGTAYCLVASNAASPRRWVYDSANGGPQFSNEQTCPAGYPS